MAYLMSLEKRRHWHLNDILLSAEMAKGLPSYSRLDLNDQAAQLRESLLPVSLLTEAFYSYQHRMDTIYMPDGFTPVLHHADKVIRAGYR